MYPGLRGRTAVVTGGGRGIGRAVAVKLASNGCRLVVNYRKRDEDASQTARLIASSGGECELVRADLSHSEAVEELFSFVARRGRADIIVNCAGLGIAAPVKDVSQELWDKQVDVNMKASFMCTRAFLGQLDGARWGRVMFISSVAGLHGIPKLSVYSATKAGLIGMTKSIAAEAPEGVTVNAVAPGLVKTNMGESLLSYINVSEEAWVSQNTVTGRLVTPEEVAELVAFLCSDFGASITGQVIVIDGGQEVAQSRNTFNLGKAVGDR